MTDGQFAKLSQQLADMESTLMAGFATITGLLLAAEDERKLQRPLDYDEVTKWLGGGVEMVAGMIKTCREEVFPEASQKK
jgi:hypothetical protein